MLKLDRVEFYITNVCNLGCNNCNRLNNFYFSGHQNWQDYASVYKKWSERVDFGSITILGGEPTLNPSIKEWCIGIREFWPNAEIEILSNGTRINKLAWLYNMCKDYQIDISITAHGRNRYHKLVNEIDAFFQTRYHVNYALDEKLWLKTYANIKDKTWPECSVVNDFYQLPNWIQEECTDLHGIDPKTFSKNTGTHTYEDINKVKILLNFAENFVSAPLHFDGKEFTVYDSDREKAHDICISKYCHHFVKGKLYKCHHVALLPEFLEQFQVNITSKDKQLLEKYRPGTLDMSDRELESFVKNLPNSIEQCKLCPQKLEDFFLDGNDKKPKLKKSKTIPIMSV